MLEGIIEDYKLIQDNLNSFYRILNVIQNSVPYESGFTNHTIIFIPGSTTSSTYDVIIPEDTSSFYVPEQGDANADYSGLLGYFDEQARLSDDFSAVIRTFDGNTHYVGGSLEDQLEREAELNFIEGRFRNYMENHNPKFQKYLESKGMDSVEIAGYGSATMGTGVVAAMLSNTNNGIYLTNDNYIDRVNSLAQILNLTFDEADLLIWTHEATHAAKIHTEKETFKANSEYFLFLAETAISDEEKESYTRIAMANNEMYAREKNGEKEAN